MIDGFRDILHKYTPEERSELAARAALALLGLIVGLFIGWVVWPVERDAGTVESLLPEQKASYLSAVADAYVASGGQNVESTLTRLSDLSDPDLDIVNAIRYFQESNRAGSAVQEINLRALATAIQADESVTISLQEPADNSTSPLRIQEPEIGWLNWILVMSTAVLLTLGGLWIAVQLLRQHGSEQVGPADDDYFDEDDEVELDPENPASGYDLDESEEDLFDFSPTKSAAQRVAQWEAMMESDKPSRSANADTSGMAATQPSPTSSSRWTTDVPIVMEVGLDIEDQDAVDAEDMAWSKDDFDQASRIVAVNEAWDSSTDDDEQEMDVSIQEDDRIAGSLQKVDEAPHDQLEDDRQSEITGQAEDPGTDTERSSSDVIVFSPTRTRDTQDVQPGPAESENLSDTGNQANVVEPEPFDSLEPSDSPAPPLPGPATAPRQPKSSTPATKNKATKQSEEGGLVGTMQGMIGSIWPKESSETRQAIVTEFTATYHHSISDYDESFVITGGKDTDERLGACGMGTQKELDPRAASNDKVQVLDVWFYDRADFRTYSQLLVSSVVDWDSLDGKVDNSGTVTGDPLVAEPGVTFRLQGKDLMLDCRVETVEYLQQDADYAPFNQVSVVMTVRRKR